MLTYSGLVAVLFSMSILLSPIRCDLEHRSHHNNVIWQTILSSLGIDWENKTETTRAPDYTNTDSHQSEITARNKRFIHVLPPRTFQPVLASHLVGKRANFLFQDPARTDRHEGHHSSKGTISSMLSTDYDADAIFRSDGIRTTVDDGAKAALVLIITIPIVVIVIVCCIVFWICRCCCECCRSSDQNIIVVQNPQQPTVCPPPTQVMVHPQHLPPPYEMQRGTDWAPQQQWNAVQQQPPQSNPNAYHNPSYSPPFNPGYSESPPPKY